MHNLHAHLVFTTKYRRGALTDPILTRCQQVMADVCADFGAELREFNGEDDHVHLLVHYPPSRRPSKLVNSLKGVSARYLRPGVRDAPAPVPVGRAPVVPVVLRRFLRRRTARRGQGIHRKPETSRSVTAFLPALKGRGSRLSNC